MNNSNNAQCTTPPDVSHRQINGYPPLGVEPDTIPDALKTRHKWGLWKAEPKAGNPGKFNKAPCGASGGGISINDPEKWLSFEEAITAYRTGRYSGIGILLDGSIVGIDIDNAPETFKNHPELKRLLQDAIDKGVYCEKSPSGKGLRLFVKGDLKRHLNGTKGGTKRSNLEIYQDKRFLTVTGQGGGDIIEAQDLIDRIVALIKTASPTKTRTETNVVPLRPEQAAPALSAEELKHVEQRIAQGVEKAKPDLWAGNLDGGDGGEFDSGTAKTYEDRSQADIALMCEVVRQCDAEQIPDGQVEDVAIAVFGQSGLVRDKWLEREDYRERTFAKARELVADEVAQRRQTVKHAEQEIGEVDRNDVLRAEQYAKRFASELRYNHTTGQWMHYTDGVWKTQYGAELEKSKQLADIINTYAQQVAKADPDSSKAKKWQRFAAGSYTAKALIMTPKIASTDPRMHVAQVELDPNPDLLCVRNGYIDLQTGKCYEPNPDKLMSRQAGTHYDPDATCPLWEKSLAAMFPEHPEIVDFLQVAVGYSATGHVTEEKLFDLYGFGRNGKSVFQNTILRALGTYTNTSPPSLLVWKTKDDGPKSELAALAGSRIASVNELESGDRLHEQTVKRLAGREPIAARFLYGQYFEYWPTAKVWLRTNHQPIITGTDDGIWRRIVLIPFKQQFIGADDDPKLEYKLAQELPGILAWIVRGAQRWYQEGLILPPVLQRELNTYRGESDILGRFLDEYTTPDPIGRVKQGDLWFDWKTHCERDGLAPGTKNSFTRRLKERGIGSLMSNGDRYYKGLKRG